MDELQQWWAIVATFSVLHYASDTVRCLEIFYDQVRKTENVVSQRNQKI